MSGDLHGMALRKQLEEKVKEAAKSRKLAEEEMEAARALIDEAKAADAPAAEAEAALAEASSAYAAKSYKESLDHAQEARERARRSLHTRAKSVLDASATMLELTRKLGADVSDMEAALRKAQDAYGKDDLTAALDHGKKVWKRSEKMLHEHLASRFSSAQSLIVAAKNVGKDVKTAEDLLARARGAVENQDYELALSYTKECLDHIASGLRDEAERILQEAESLAKLAAEVGGDGARVRPLLEKSRYEMDRGEFEKAMETARQGRAEAEKGLQRSVELRLVDLGRALQEAEGIAADVRLARDLQKGVERGLAEKRYAEALEYLKRAAAEVQNAQFQRVLQIVAASREKFVTARAVGADISHALDYLNEARTALQAGRHREALDFARKADAEVDRLAGEAIDLMQRVQQITRGVAEGDRNGLNTAEARRLMDIAKKAMEERDVRSVREYVRQAGEALARAEYDRAMEAIEQAEFILTSGEKAGAQLGEARALLDEAIALAKAKDHRPAIAKAVLSRTQAESTVQRLLGDKIAGLKAVLGFVGADAGSVRSLVEKAEGAVGARDFEGAFVYLEEAHKLTEGKTKDKAAVFADELRGLVELADSLGADTRSGAGVLKEVTAALEAGRFADTLGLRERHKKEVATLVEDVFNLVKEKVVEAKSLNLDIGEMRELLKKGRLALDTEDHATAIAVFAECDRRAGAAMKAHKETYSAISSAAALVADAKRKGSEVTAALELLLEAKRAFEGTDYPKALELANRAKEETRRLMLVYSAGQQIKSAREKADFAAQAGVDSPHLRALLDEAREAMKNRDYETALALGQRAERDGTQLLQDRVTALLSAAESLLPTLEGVELVAHEQRLLKARELIEAGDWAGAAGVAKGVRDELEGLRRRTEEGQVGVKKAEDLVAEVEAMNIEVPASRRLLDMAKRAMRSAQPEQAGELAAKCVAELAKERDASIERTMKRFEESIAQAKKAGVNTRSAERVLAKAREELKAHRYRQALALAMQSEKETERAGVQQEMASKAIATALRKLEEFGGSAPDVEGLVVDARKAFDEGDYVLALELAIRSGDELGKRKELGEETQEVRELAQALLAAGRKVGADVARLEDLFRGGEASASSGDLGKAQRFFQEVVEYGVRACRTRLEGRLQEATGQADLAARLGVDVDSLRKRLAEGRGLLESESFEAAHAEIVAASEEARKAAEAHVADALRRAKDAVDHARGMGADTAAAESVLEGARARLAEGDLEGALRASEEARRGLRAPEAGEDFLQLTFDAESTLKNARKFGIDVREAERVLAQAVQRKDAEPEEARRLATRARELANEAIEAFAPKVEGTLEHGEARVGEWLETAVRLRNSGKALAKDVRVRILGDVEIEGGTELPALRAKGEERLPVRLRFAEAGTVPLAIQVTCVRLIDGREYTEEAGVQVEVAAGTPAPAEEAKPLLAEIETSCPLCKGKIRRGLAIAKCECGRDYHQPCATRAGQCVACGKPLRTVEKKRKLSFKLG